jgi:TolB-like protein/DNA-binding winged helix-turn-helix (wHTH) protein/tetratricopeptide (TPR) repeat protein
MEIVVFGEFQMDRKRRLLLAGKRIVPLHGRTFDILDCLVEHRDRVLTRDDIVAVVWHGVAVGESNVTVQISTLRRALCEFGGGGLVITVPGRGYRFVGELKPAAATAAPETAGTPAPPPGTLPPAEAPARAPARRAWHRHAARAGGAACALALGLAALLAWRPSLPPGPTVSALPGAPSFTPPPHSVAILAFSNMTGDPSQEYVSDGLADQLIDTLSRSPDLRVVARTSSFYFKGKPTPVSEIAHRLNVGAVLDGSVRREGPVLRVTAQLTDARSGYTLWSRSFDRGQGDLLKTETEIASSVSEALQSGLLTGGDGRDTAHWTANAGAFDAYLRGVQAQRLHSKGSDKLALSEFQAALALDDHFALAHSARAAALAWVAASSGGLTIADTRRMFGDAMDSAQRGIALAPDLAETHAARGLVLQLGYFDHAGAMQELRKARQLAPGSASIEQSYAEAAIGAGELSEGIAAARHATALDPLREDSWDTVGYALYTTRDYAGALDAFRHARAIGGPLSDPHVMIEGATLVLQGHPEEAVRTCGSSQAWEAVECLAIAEHAAGQPAQAAKQLQRLRDMLGDNGAYNYAVVYAQWGDAHQALSWLEVALRFKDAGLSGVSTDPLLDPLRGTREYADFTRRVALVQ